MRKRITLFLVIAFLISFPNFIYASPLESVNQWIESQLSSNTSSVVSYFFLFIGGIVASLLPCTYPLYPITINILKSRSSGSNKLLYPAVYYFGIASMYFLFGIIASLTGGAFNTVLRFPLTNLIIAVIILLLGLSSMDLLHLPVFSGSNISNKKKGLAATYLMGLSAGLLSSACVGPVVVSILIGIASNSTTFSLLLSLTAASKMLLFGIGVGVPFLLIGVFGVSLPKSGKWMKYIQFLLGALILYFSFIYLEKAMLGYGYKSETILLVTVSGIAIFITVFFLQSSEMQVQLKTGRALLILTAIVSSALLIKALSYSTVSTVDTSVNKSTPETEQKGNLTWYLNKEAAYAAAKEKNKPVFIDFHADWCTNCKAFQKTTQNNSGLNKALANAILLKVYEGTPVFKTYADDKRFPELKVGLPFFLITDKDENLLYKTNDYLKADEMGMFLSTE